MLQVCNAVVEVADRLPGLSDDQQILQCTRTNEFGTRKVSFQAWELVKLGDLVQYFRLTALVQVRTAFLDVLRNDVPQVFGQRLLLDRILDGLRIDLVLFQHLDEFIYRTAMYPVGVKMHRNLTPRLR